MRLQERALRLAENLPWSRMHPEARAVADTSSAEWFVALSGGADSVCVLLLLWATWAEQRSKLRVLHFNHRLRGAESDEDELFCADLCAELNVSLIVRHWENAPKPASEADAREARFNFFDSQVPTGSAALLFTGHHGDDVVETQLMRLARGSSSAGLCAPRPVREWRDRGRVVRPLLNLTREEIKRALKSAGIGWREDMSNAGDQFLRNRLRQDVVPRLIQAAGPGCLAGALLTREWLQEDDEALSQFVDTLQIDWSSNRIDLAPLCRQPKAIWRRALRRWAPAANLERSSYERLLAICREGVGSLNVTAGLAEVREGVLELKHSAGANAGSPWEGSRLLPDTVMMLPDAGSLAAAVSRVTASILERISRRQLDSSRECLIAHSGEGLSVRNWRSGDRYRPLGAPGTSKLQDLFTNSKLDPALKHRIPVVCAADGRILWVPGFPPADESKVTDQTVMVVQLTYTPGTITVRKQS